MTRKVIIGISFFILVVLVALPLLRKYTKTFSPQETATYQDGDFSILVDYSRPYKKDRLIFGSEEEGALVPYGKKWRTGANEATEIEFSHDVEIRGEDLPEGRYSMYTIPSMDTWVLAINKDTDYWGINPAGETFDEENDAVRVKIPSSRINSPQEQFLIDFVEGSNNKVIMRMTWDQTRAEVPIKKKS